MSKHIERRRIVSKYDDGGPAFPVIQEGMLGVEGGPGMKLHDWFAGQIAAAGFPKMIDTALSYAKQNKMDEVDQGPKLLAKTAYIVAEYLVAEKRRREAGDA